MKSNLIILTQAPPGGLAQLETLQALLTLASFDMPVTLLFAGHGSRWLDGRLPWTHLGQTPWNGIAPLLTSLPLYDLNPIYVDQAIVEPVIACQLFDFDNDWRSQYAKILVW